MTQENETLVVGHRGSGFVPLPKNIIDVVSQIQQYYTLEKEGTTIPSDFLTLEDSLDIWGIGFKSSVKNSIFSALLAPFMIGVFYKYIPIFGSFNPTLYDRLWAITVTYSLTICYAFFLSSITRYYIGDITRSAIKNLFSGIIVGAILTTIAIFMLYHSLYYLVLTEKNVASILLAIKSFISLETLERIYYWIINFRKSFIIASWVVLFNMLCLLIIPLSFILLKARKTNIEIKNRDKWQIGI